MAYKHITSILLAASLVAVSACTVRTQSDVRSTGNTAEEFVIVEPEPISREPVYTGKYK